MTVTLDAVLRAGDATVAAVVEQRLRGFRAGGALSFHGTKRPVAILIRRGGVTLVFDAAGHPLTPEAFDALYPGLREQFERLERNPKSGNRFSEKLRGKLG